MDRGGVDWDAGRRGDAGERDNGGRGSAEGGRRAGGETIIERKEREYREFWEGQYREMEEKVRRKDDSLLKLQQNFIRLQEDFEYNLDVIRERDGEIAEFEKTLGVLHDRLAQEGQERENLMKLVKELKQQNLMLQEDKIHNGENIKKKLTFLQENLTQAIASHGEERDTLLHQINNHKSLLNEKNLQIDQLHQEFKQQLITSQNNHKQIIDTMTIKVNSLSEQLTVEISRSNRLVEVRSMLETELFAANEVIQTLGENHEKLFAEHQATKERWEKERNLLNEEINDLKEEETALRGRVKEMETEFFELKDVERKLSKKQDECERLITLYEKLENEKEELERGYERREREREREEREREQRDREQREIERERERREREIREYGQQEERERMYREREEERDVEREEWEKKERKVREKIRTLEEFIEQRDQELLRTHETIQNLQDQLIRASETYQDQLARANDNISRSQEKLETELSRANHKAATLQQQLEQLHALEDSSTQGKEIEELTRENEELRTLIGDMRVQMESTYTQQNEWKREKGDLEREIHQKIKIIDDLTESANRSQRKLDALERDIKFLRGENQKLMEITNYQNFSLESSTAAPSRRQPIDSSLSAIHLASDRSLFVDSSRVRGDSHSPRGRTAGDMDSRPMHLKEASPRGTMDVSRSPLNTRLTPANDSRVMQFSERRENSLSPAIEQYPVHSALTDGRLNKSKSPLHLRTQPIESQFTSRSKSPELPPTRSRDEALPMRSKSPAIPRPLSRDESLPPRSKSPANQRGFSREEARPASRDAGRSVGREMETQDHTGDSEHNANIRSLLEIKQINISPSKSQLQQEEKTHIKETPSQISISERLKHIQKQREQILQRRKAIGISHWLEPSESTLP